MWLAASLHRYNLPFPTPTALNVEVPSKIRNSPAHGRKTIIDDETRLVFTYGTLKRGFYNHKLMQELMATRDASFVGEYVTLESFPLVVGPFGIPFLINLQGSGHRVSGELYAVSGRGLARLDELEGISTGHYERLSVKVVVGGDCGGGEVVATEVYFAHRSFAGVLWRKCGEMALSEYGKEMRANYVKRPDRPLGCNFVDEVWKFISKVELSDCLIDHYYFVNLWNCFVCSIR